MLEINALRPLTNTAETQLQQYTSRPSVSHGIFILGLCSSVVSDADLVEFEGKVLFVGNWGDQRTTPTNSLYQAVFDGTMAEFWASLYPPAVVVVAQ